MTHRFWLYLFGLTIVGCQPDVPVLTEEMMRADSAAVEILVDLHLADANLFDAAVSELEGSSRIEIERMTFETFGPRDSVLHAHGMDEAAFMASMRQYLDDPERFMAIYNRVLDRASVGRE